MGLWQLTAGAPAHWGPEEVTTQRRSEKERWPSACVCGPGGDPDPGLSRLEVAGLAGSHWHRAPPALGSGPGLAPGGLVVTGALWSWGGRYSGRQRGRGAGASSSPAGAAGSGVRGGQREVRLERWAGADCGGL